MEIEFNTGRIPQQGYSQPAVRQTANPAQPDTASFSTSDSLNSQLSSMSTVRPEQVARARELVADENYPSDEVLNRVANRLVNESEANSSS
jgi:hypothetical protein